MKSSALHLWLIRIIVFIVPVFSVFYTGIYEHPNLRERKILKICLLSGFLIYITAGVSYLII